MTLRVQKAEMTGFDESQLARFGGNVPEPLEVVAIASPGSPAARA
jgi:hypothetical protein